MIAKNVCAMMNDEDTIDFNQTFYKRLKHRLKLQNIISLLWRRIVDLNPMFNCVVDVLAVENFGCGNSFQPKICKMSQNSSQTIASRRKIITATVKCSTVL